MVTSRIRRFRMIGLLFGMLVFVNLSGCKTLSGLLDSMYQKPTMKYRTMNLRDISFQGVTTDFVFDLTNPNSVAVDFASIQYKLDIDGYTLFEGQTEKGVKIRANATSPINAPFTIRYKKFIKALLSFFQKKRFVTYELAVSFAVKVPVLGVVNFPFNLRGKIPIPQLPKVSVVKVTPPQVSLFPPRATMNFRVKLENRAPFPVSLNRLNYSIAISGSNIAGGESRGQKLSGGKATILDIPLSINPVKAGYAVFNAVKSKQFSYRFQGKLDMGLFKVPINVGGNIRM